MLNQGMAEGSAVAGVFVSLTGKRVERQSRADRLLLFLRNMLNVSFFQAPSP